MKRILTILLTILVMYVPVFADQVSYAYDNAGNRIKREIVIDTRVVDESGNAVERMSYDAWGNLRDPQTHKVYEAGKAPGLMLGRGLQSLGNHAYFGEPIISTKDLLIGTAFGALTAGAINGSAAAYEGRTFWTGEMIAKGKGTFSFNNPQIKIIPEPEVNPANSNLSDVSPKVRGIADKLLSGKRIPLRDYQEAHFVIEEGGYKMDFRIENHGRLNNVFKDLNIDPTIKIRHMNIQLYEWNGRKYIEIPVPGYGRENYHLFLNFKKK